MGFTLYYLLKKTPLRKENGPITEMGVAPLGIIVVSHNLAWFWTQTTAKKSRRLDFLRDNQRQSDLDV